jgi:tRNA G37 N-methylase Trm5
MPAQIDFIAPYANDAVLRVSNRNANTVQSFVVGLHEYEDMSFLLHMLRPDDLFVDVGANAGVYSVLAGKAVGSRCVSIEPIPSVYEDLQCNILLNQMGDRVEALNIGVGDKADTLRFTACLGGFNHVVSPTSRSRT